MRTILNSDAFLLFIRYFSDQLKERSPRLRPTASLDLAYVTPFRAAIYVKEDYTERKMTMELYDTVQKLYSNTTLVEKLYDVSESTTVFVQCQNHK